MTVRSVASTREAKSRTQGPASVSAEYITRRSARDVVPSMSPSPLTPATTMTDGTLGPMP